MASVDRLERLTDLVLVLLHSRSARTLDEIVQAVPGYPTSHVARRQAFERDKRILRDEGIPVLAEPLEGPDQFGYRIDPDTFYLADPGLTPDEQAALRLAVAGVHLADPSGMDALAKLGASGAGVVRPLVALDTPDALATLFGALRAGAQVTIVYRAERRDIAPQTIEFREGRWYLVGWDRRRRARRVFRVDRIEEIAAVGEPGSAGEPGTGDSVEALLEPWSQEESDAHIDVRVDAVEGPRVAAEVGEAHVIERDVDGSVLLRLGVGRFPALRSWVLALGSHAEIVAPSDARAAIVAWLEAVRDAAPLEVPDTPDGARIPFSADPRSKRAESRTARSTVPVRTASARLRRLLAIVAWLAEVHEARLDEVCARFGLEEGEAIRELELAACCGTPPYSPDALLEIVVDSTSVRAFLPAALARPRRLTPAEGFAVAASARAILAVPGADRLGRLASALGKLERVLGDREALVVHMDAPVFLDAVRDALDGGAQIEIQYHSASTDTTGRRVVEPIDVLSIDGHWYLDAWCHQARGVRRFRVDRVRAVRALDARVSHRAVPRTPGGEAFIPGPGARPVTLRLDDGARWVEDTLPVLSARDGPQGTRDVTLSVGGLSWLEGLLLQLGPDASVVGPPELRAVGALAAARLLERYGRDNMKQHGME